MIVKPKSYSKGVLGGYLLNEVKFSEYLFIEKKGYGEKSELSENNKIYDMLNKMSSIPFKINTDLLEYLINNWQKHDLLIDPNTTHKLNDLEKRTKYQENINRSYNSKIILQETVLGIAQFFSKFSEIYFPVRIDQRGKLYCSLHYLNYQANELAKALLLFANPAVITKTNMECFSYLKLYGANCYGNRITKLSSQTKLEWIDKNIDNILNYDNSI